MRPLLVISVVIILLSLAAGISFMDLFPEDIPSHWNIQGEADGYMAKEIGVFFLPVLALIIMALMAVVPRFDPDYARYHEFQTAYDGLILLITIFFTVLYLVTLLWAIGVQIPMNSLMSGIFGILFMGIGFFFHSVQKNWFVGIRTPWTLLSEHVWQKTHRAGFYVFIAIGIICFGGIIFPVHAYLFIFFPLFIGVCGLVLYSYYLYQRETQRMDN